MHPLARRWWLLVWRLNREFIAHMTKTEPNICPTRWHKVLFTSRVASYTCFKVFAFLFRLLDHYVCPVVCACYFRYHYPVFDGFREVFCSGTCYPWFKIWIACDSFLWKNRVSIEEDIVTNGVSWLIKVLSAIGRYIMSGISKVVLKMSRLFSVNLIPS